jgi:hypothetical protein
VDFDISHAFTEPTTLAMPYYLSGEECDVDGVHCVGVLRSRLCISRAISFGKTGDTCAYCAEIPSAVFKKKVKRRAAATLTGSTMGLQTKNSNLTLAAAISLKLTLGAQVSRQRHQLFLLGAELARARSKAFKIKDRMADDAKRGDLRALVHRLQAAHDANESVGTPLARQLILDAARNMTVGKKGADYNTTTQGFWHVVRVWGSPKLFEFICKNLGGPGLRTVETWIAAKTCASHVNLTDEYFASLARVYAGFMQQAGITPRPWIPCLAQEDETSTIPKLDYLQRFDAVVGSCGVQCSKSCVRVKDCKCLDRHQCNPDGHVFVIGNDDESYTRLVAFLRTARVSTMARAIVISPLHRGLPRLVAVFVPTCNSFTAKGYVWPQWVKLRQLFAKHLNPLGLLLIGNGSDGDRRRAALQMASTRSAEGERYGLAVAGFTHTARKVSGADGKFQVEGVMDQDYLHTSKKPWCATDHDSRGLQLGPNKCARLPQLESVLTYCDIKDYDFRRSDLTRKGYNAMDVPSMLRCLTKRSIACIEKVVTGAVGDGRGAHLAGMLRMCQLMRRYLNMFLGLNLTHEERTQSAGCVCTYFRIWRFWVHVTPGFTLKEHFVTREAFQDLVLSCHFVPILIMVFRDLCKELGIPFDLTGSDCVEILWSALGSQVMNRRTYSFGDAFESIRAQNAISRVRAEGICKFPRVNKKLSCAGWDQDEPTPGADQGYPDQDKLEAAWLAGEAEARALATEDGMKPESHPCHNGGRGQGRRGRAGRRGSRTSLRGASASSLPSWWDAPWESETSPAKEQELQALMRSEEEDAQMRSEEFDVDLAQTGSVPPADLPLPDVPPADLVPADLPLPDVAPADLVPADLPLPDVAPADQVPADLPLPDVAPADQVPADLPLPDVPPADLVPADLPLPDVAPADLALSALGIQLKAVLLRRDPEAVETAAQELFGLLDVQLTPIRLDVYSHFISDGSFQLAASISTDNNPDG